MKIKISKQEICIIFIFTILFLFSVSIFDWAGYILILIFPMYFLFVAKQKIIIDNGMIILLIYSIMYFVSSMIYDSISIDLIVKFLLAPWFLYMFGRDIIVKYNNEKILHYLIMIFIWGFFIHGVLNLYLYIQNYGFVSLSSSNFRLTYDFWRNEPLSVTACSFYYLPMICYACGYAFFEDNKKKKIIYLIGFMVGLYANLLYSNRTAIYIIAVLIFLGLFFVLFQSKIKKRKIVFLLLSIFTIIVLVSFDMFGIRSWILNLGIIDRLLGKEVGRLSVWIDFILGDWMLYPFGGYMAGKMYAHNLWLDTLRAVGIIPFVALLLFTFYSISQVIKMYINCKKQSLPYIFMLIGIILSFMVEPITDANPYYFLLTLLVLGGIKGFNMKNDKSERNNKYKL